MVCMLLASFSWLLGLPGERILNHRLAFGVRRRRLGEAPGSEQRLSMNSRKKSGHGTGIFPLPLSISADIHENSHPEHRKRDPSEPVNDRGRRRLFGNEYRSDPKQEKQGDNT